MRKPGLKASLLIFTISTILLFTWFPRIEFIDDAFFPGNVNRASFARAIVRNLNQTIALFHPWPFRSPLEFPVEKSMAKKSKRSLIFKSLALSSSERNMQFHGISWGCRPIYARTCLFPRTSDQFSRMPSVFFLSTYSHDTLCSRIFLLNLSFANERSNYWRDRAKSERFPGSLGLSTDIYLVSSLGGFRVL